MTGVPPFCGRAARTHPRRPPQEAGKGYNPVLCQAFLSKKRPGMVRAGKKLLANPKKIIQYNRDKANKGRDVESWNLPTPLCRRCDLPHSRISAPCPLYRESPLFTRGEIAVWVCVLYWGCAGIIVPCTALLFAPTGIACGGRYRPPRGSVWGPRRGLAEKSIVPAENCQRKKRAA